MMGHLERSRIFLEVAERSSFADASRALNLSRSVVTRQVAELEEELGVQLFVRTTRKVALTAPGAIYADRMRTAIRQIDQATDAVRDEQHTLRGTLKVSAPLSFGMRFLPDAIARFRILYPDLTLAMDLTDRFVDILRDDYDMALRISGPPTDRSTIWRKICEVPRVLAASPDYVARRGSPAKPQELARHNCLAYSNSNDPQIWRLRNGDERADVSIASKLACNNGELLADLAIAGEGIVLLPRFIMEEALIDGRLVQVLPDWPPEMIWLTAFYPPYERLPAKVDAFTRFIEDAVAADQEELPNLGQKKPARRL
ncbi:LysR substrate-binding domain-containing protein [Georhizobium sp. MAB10]|uniref:LysR family transcriptional regulator n=1 Tax=Georhizobium sp. MAB10 TaxID=3028319 RepID=UPI003855F8C7